jgi:hypothetical protein
MKESARAQVKPCHVNTWAWDAIWSPVAGGIQEAATVDPNVLIAQRTRCE